jgi:hypothetical protein
MGLFFYLKIRPKEYYYKDLAQLWLDVSGNGADVVKMPKAAYKYFLLDFTFLDLLLLWLINLKFIQSLHLMKLRG